MTTPALTTTTRPSAAPGTAAAPGSTAAPAPDDARPGPVSDDFAGPAPIDRWQRFEPVASDGAAFEELAVAAGRGVLRMVPTRSVWFAGSRGAALLQEVTGDVVVTTRVRARGRAAAVPTSAWSLVGLLLRAPVADGEPESWVYLTTGSDGDANPTVDSKSTVDGASDYVLAPAHWDWVDLRVVRVGVSVVHLYRLDDGPWRVVRVVVRPDLPATVQVGLNVLTAFAGGEPDLVAEVEHVTFSAVDLPAEPAALLRTGAAGETDVAALRRP